MRMLAGWIAGLIVACLGSPALAGPDEQRYMHAIEVAEKQLGSLERTARTSFRRGQLFERVGFARRQLGHQRGARKAYRRALDAYAEGGHTRSRNRLLRRLSQPVKNWSRTSAGAFKEILKTWQAEPGLRRKVVRLARSARRSTKVEDPWREVIRQVTEMGRIARRHNDPALKSAWLVMQGEVEWVKDGEPARIARLRQAAEACANGVCPDQHRRCLDRAARLLEANGQFEEAYRLFAQLNALSAADLPESRKLYARSSDLVRVCDRLRGLPDSPSCRQLEQQAVGFVTYRDFSIDRVHPSLAPAVVEQVHREYVSLLSECLMSAVRRDEVLPGDSLELAWTVRNDGRISKAECMPPIKELGVWSCFKNALRLFRYPRFTGQRQNITLPLAVQR